jgi:hypothetical protein
MRPDEKRFEQFSEHLAQLDPTLEQFARSKGFSVEKNPFHEPSRYLRKPGNPHQLIVISLDQHWRTAGFERDMQHSMTAISYYFPSNDPATVWTRADAIAKSTPFSQLASQIEQLLTAALNVLVATTAESIVQTGERGDNLAFKYKEYLP